MVQFILIALACLVYIGQNSYFGWNDVPMSQAERWWDNFVLALLWCSMFYSLRKIWRGR